MSIMRCIDCEIEYDTDEEDGSYSDDGDFMCNNCSDKTGGDDL